MLRKLNQLQSFRLIGDQDQCVLEILDNYLRQLLYLGFWGQFIEPLTHLATNDEH